MKCEPRLGATMAGTMIIGDLALVFAVGDCAIYFSDATVFKVFIPARTPDGKLVTDFFGRQK